MRLNISKSKNSSSLYVIKDINVRGKRTTKIVEKLGTYDELLEKLNGRDPIEWAQEYIKELNEEEQKKKQKVIVKYSPIKKIKKDQQRLFNGGYLFLQKIYHELALDKLCDELAKKYKFTFDLNSILSRLVYGRILFPSSKLATHRQATSFIEPPNFELQHIYRALDILAKESDFIQTNLYKNSLEVSKRNTGILYYDCTNYFFEIEQEEGLKQYGVSKEHRPNPIVQMGLFMDGDGIPLAFSIHKGNTNEQATLKPLEKKILNDFKLSKFVVCTDAGLASYNNRRFNDIGERAFITTQSIKKLKKHLKEWALSPGGWSLAGKQKLYNISELEERIDSMTDDQQKERWLSKVFYKERWIKENGLEQKMIITFSFKYRNYQQRIRQEQILRAQKKIDSNPSKIGKARQNDYRRFIKTTTCTEDGEIANKKIHHINTDVIDKEKIYDGFYGICTNLEADTSEIIKVNKGRWQIEECFRIMKTELKARPVYLSKDERIEAHFITCFISLLIYRLLEKQLNSKFTCSTIIRNLRNMNFLEAKGEGYIPAYTRNDFTDTLHETFGFRTDYEIVTNKKIKKIISETKK
ncbi:MAG: IS1634 family transposase [bacterium]